MKKKLNYFKFTKKSQKVESFDMSIKKKIIINVLISLLLISIPLIFFANHWMHSSLPATVKGYIYEKNIYVNYGHGVTAVQNNNKEKRITSYNGQVEFYSIDPRSPYQIIVTDKSDKLITSKYFNKKETKFAIVLPKKSRNYKLAITLIGLMTTFFFLTIFVIIIIRDRHHYLGLPFFISILGPFSFYLASFIQHILAQLGYETIAGNIFAFHRLGYLFFPASFLHFCYTLSYKRNLPSIYSKILYAPALLSVPVLMSWPICQSDTLYTYLWGFSFDNFNQAFIIYTFVCFLFGVRGLFHTRITDTKKYYKKKIQKIIIGILLSLSIFICLFLLPQLFLIPEAFQGYYDLVIMISQLILYGTLTYGIINNHILDFNLLINKTLLYTTLSLSFASIYIIVLDSLVVSLSTESLILFSTIYIFVLFIFLEPLRYILQRYSDHFFFPEQTILKPAMDYYSDHIATSLDKKVLIEHANKLFRKYFLITELSVFFYNTKNSSIHNYIETDQSQINKYNISHEQIKTIKSLNFITNYDEDILQNLPFIKDIIDSLKSEVATILCYKNEFIGILFFGSKSNKKAYSAGELKLLASLSRHISLALANCFNNERMIETEKSLLHSEKLSIVGKISASLAHEIKNPLAVIIPLVKVLPEMINDQDYLKEFMDIVPRQLERIDNKIKTLLTYSKPGSGKKEQGFIEDIIEEAATIFYHQLTIKNIKLELGLSRTYPIFLCKEDFISVFNNLILNSIESIGSNGVIKIESYADEEKITITISDSGRGIVPEIQERIFEPFFTSKQNGTGIGLCTVAQIINSHNGSITVNSKVGKGTAFIINLALLNT